METISLKITRLESILILNVKFAKKWLKMLDKHRNSCPCKYYNYIESSYKGFKFSECPFNIRKDNSNCLYECFSCDFSRILGHTPFLRYYHIKSAIKSVIKFG